MTSRPILFGAPMIRALLAGRKTQTRRAVNPQPSVGDGGCWFPEPPRKPAHRARHYASEAHMVKGLPVDFCPYGQPGDELWVRETWSPVNKAAVAELVPSRTREDHESKVAKLPKATYRADHGAAAAYGRWHPSIHMPRWASRITLRVTSVRVERLQAISEADAMAEGAAHRISPGGDLAGAFDTCDTPINYRAHFRDLWESINGAGSWAANPWVWCVGFEVRR